MCRDWDDDTVQMVFDSIPRGYILPQYVLQYTLRVASAHSRVLLVKLLTDHSSQTLLQQTQTQK